MAFEIATIDTSVTVPAKIENFEALKAEIEKSLALYRDLVVTEDAISRAKSDRAKLNKLTKAISDKRISEKKKCLESCAEFEAQCKELEALIVAPVAAIDTQIKAFEEKERNEKLLKLKMAFYKTRHHDWLSFDCVLPEKWANKTEKTEKLIEEINKEVERINAEFSEIGKMYINFPLLTAITDQYKRTRNKADTLAYAVTLEKQYLAEQESKKEQETRQRESVENAHICHDAPSSEIIPENSQTAADVDSGADQSEPLAENKITGTFRVTCMKSQLIALRDFMKENKIEFEVLKG